MNVHDWQAAAMADARRRGLDDVAALLEGLGTSLTALREATARLDLDEAANGAPGGEAPSVPGARPSRTTDPATAAPGAEVPTLATLVARLSRGEVRAERLVEDCLAVIEARQPELNAFITITAEEALAAARQADRDAAAGRISGPLHGIPMSLKDLIDQAGVATTAASRVRQASLAAGDAPATARLRRAGAVFVGKTNLHEYAFGTTSEDSAYGPARHPFDPSRSPGGSSGGSAISVATGMALASVGTDTGGSVRIPAAACGIVGLKPGWGEIPAAGVVPLGRTLDHVGPMTRTVADAWLLYDVMRGAGAVTPPAAAAPGALRIGVPRGYLFDRLDEQVEQQVMAAIERLAVAGAQVVTVEVPHASEAPMAYLPIVLAEGAEYHAPTLDGQPGDYTTNVRMRLEMGRYVLAEDYVRASRLRARLRREVDAALAEVDVLALPALAIPAPPIGAATMPVRGGSDAVRTLMLRCTQPFNLTGHPALSLPCGRTTEGLPAGLQLVGRRGATTHLLETALAVEAVFGRA